MKLSYFRRRQSGAAHVEYIVVTTLLVLVLLSNPNVIQQLVEALRKAYASFTYALSVSWF